MTVRPNLSPSNVMDSNPQPQPQPDLPASVQKMLAAPLPRTVLGQFLDGFKTPLTGLRLMNSLTGLWRYGIAPAIASLLVTLFVVVGLLAGLWYGAEPLHHYFEHNWSGWALEVLAFAGVFGVGILLAFVTWLLCQTVFVGYFYSVLLVQVEQCLGVPAEQLEEAPLVQQTIDSIVDITKFLVISIALLLLGLVPLIGPACAAAAVPLFNSLVAGYEFLDYPMVVRGQRRKERRRFARRHRWYTVGVGASVLCLLLIPFVGAMMLCTTAAGTSVLYRRLERCSGTQSASPGASE